MVTVDKTGSNVSHGLVELTADKEAEIATLETNYAIHSSVFVIETGEIYFLTEDRKWERMG